jgi:excisionase family DNA binding protein
MGAVAIMTDEQLQALLTEAAKKGAELALAAGGPQTLSTEQAAAIANVSPKTVREWISSGALPAGRRGQRRTIQRADLDRYLAGRPEGGGARTAEELAGTAARRPA